MILELDGAWCLEIDNVKEARGSEQALILNLLIDSSWRRCIDGRAGETLMPPPFDADRLEMLRRYCAPGLRVS